MKRAAGRGEGSGAPKRGRGPRIGQHAFKLLCPERLVASVLGNSGATVAQIQDQSGAHLTFARRGEFFPESRLRILVISAEGLKQIVDAMELVLQQLVDCSEEERQEFESTGSSTGELLDTMGNLCIRCALTESVGAEALGASGQGIVDLSDETGANVWLDDLVYDNHQLATLSGDRQQLLMALERLCEFAHVDVEEPWFSQWVELRAFPTPGSSGAGGGGGRTLSHPQSDRPVDNRSLHEGCTIFVGGLKQTSEAKSLRGYFSRYGKILDADVRMDSKTSRSKGFGFVTFAESYMVDRVIENVKDHAVDGKRVDVRRRYGEAGNEAEPAVRTNDRSSANLPIDRQRWERQPDGRRRELPGSNGDGREPHRGDRDNISTKTTGQGRGISWFLGIAKECPEEYLNLDYQITSSLPKGQCGALIGVKCENIKEKERITGAKVMIDKNLHGGDYRQLSVQGSLLSVYGAHMLLMQDFNHNAEAGNESELASQQKIEEIQRQIDSLKKQVGKRR